MKTVLHRLYQKFFPEKAQAVLSPDWDDTIVARVHRAVEALGGSISETSWGVGGSVEMATYSIRLPAGRLTITGETYQGLSVRGPKHLVERFVSAVYCNDSSPTD